METKPDKFTERAINEIATLIEGVEQGDVSAYKSYIKLKEFESEMKKAINQIKEEALREVENRNGEATYDGFIIRTKNAAGRWNFKNIDKWKELESEKKKLENELKELYKAKQSSYERGKGLNMADENGEVVTLPEYTPGSITLQVGKK